MNIVLKILCRRRIFTVSFTFFIMLAIELGIIAVSAKVGGQDQRNRINENYVTTAVPGGGYYGGLIEADEKGKIALEKNESIKDALVGEDRRSYFIAYTPTCTSITPYEFRNYENYKLNGDNNCLGVVAGECIKITSQVTERTTYVSEDGEYLEEPVVYNQKFYSVEFKLEKIICCAEGYNTFDNVERITLFMGDIYGENGEVPFVEGKKYCLLSSFLSNHMIERDQSDLEHGGWYFPEEFSLTMYSEPMLPEETPFIKILKTNRQGEGFYILDEGSLPYSEEYEGSIEAFLESEKGKRWREEVIPFCKRNYQSASVIATDNVDSIYNFNSGIASIIDGNKFQKSDYLKGERVCIVSATYAQRNNLQVGDSIQMELYKGHLFLNNADRELDYTGNEEMIYLQSITLDKNKLGIREQWKIIGIYSAPEFEVGNQNFNANTIFVPKESITNAREYEDCYNDLLYSIIIKNGEEKEFAKAIRTYTEGTPFIYANQGYDAVKKPLHVMQKNINRLSLACTSGAVISLLLILFLYWKSTFETIRKMRLLGVSKKKILGQILVSVLPIVGSVGVMSTGIGAMLCKTVIRMVIKTEISIQPSVIIVSGVAGTVMVLLAMGIMVLWMLRCQLLYKRIEI